MQKTIDLRDCTDMAAVHRLFAETLDFPYWYGHNLDALFDLLSCAGELQLQLILPAAGGLVESGALTTLLLVVTDALGERVQVCEPNCE